MSKMGNNKLSREYLSATVYNKSNTMITSLSSPTLLCNKLLMVSTLLAEEQEDGSFIAKVPGGELRKIFNNKSGSFYDRIYEATVDSNNSSSLMGYIAIYKDGKKFAASRLITDANFDGNVLSLRYNSSMAKYIFNLKTNYTKLNIDQMMSLKSIYSWRLLEMFQSNVDLKNWSDDKNHKSLSENYVMKVDLTDLKLMLGIIDSSNKAVIKGIKTNNYDIIESMDNNKKLAVFGNFKRDVLEHARKELEEKSDIRFDYEPIRTGRGGKVTAIIFKIYRENSNKNKIAQLKENLQRAAELGNYSIKDNLSDKDLEILLKDAGGDTDKVLTAWITAQDTKNITNLMGFLRKAIADGYVVNKESVSKTSFSNFEQRTYNFDELEKTIVNNLT